MPKIQIEITNEQLWEAVWGCDGAGMTHWSNKVRKPNGDDIDLWLMKDGKHVPNVQDFKVFDVWEDKWHKVTVKNLFKGFAMALKAKQTHCNGYALDVEDYDACFGDMIIQYAVFGKLVYG